MLREKDKAFKKKSKKTNKQNLATFLDNKLAIH